MTQVELAAVSGLHVTTISYLENDHQDATPRTIRKLAKALRCAPADLTREPEAQS
jgi:transcriptional regulator with XRE-family HTH domain